MVVIAKQSKVNCLMLQRFLVPAPLSLQFVQINAWSRGGILIGVGDSSGVQDQLKNVKQIKGSLGAFAAILEDGDVITWGSPDSGGDSRRVKLQLRDVQQVQAADDAFAAIRKDGTVVTWGCPDAGGNSNMVQYELKTRTED